VDELIHLHLLVAVVGEGVLEVSGRSIFVEVAIQVWLRLDLQILQTNSPDYLFLQILLQLQIQQLGQLLYFELQTLLHFLRTLLVLVRLLPYVDY
jgi:hypothetical protein